MYVMYVNTVKVVCSNLPTESASPENGCHLFGLPTCPVIEESSRVPIIKGRGGGSEALRTRLGGAAGSAGGWR